MATAPHVPEWVLLLMLGLLVTVLVFFGLEYLQHKRHKQEGFKNKGRGAR